MSLAGLLALILGMSLTAYALFAGGDFGAGILDLLAGRQAPERAAIEIAIGPLWEANHVWLIFAITVLFSAFPAAFSALGTALLAPLTVALVAIVLRGAALGLRASLEAGTRGHMLLSRLFGAASAVAAFAFGLVAGGVAVASRSGGIPSIPWTGTFAIVVGALAVCLCTQLAASFVAVGLARGGETRLLGRLRRRGLQAGAGVLALAVTALAVAAGVSPPMFRRLTGVALPLILLGLAAATLSLLALVARRYRVARAASLLTAAALVWGGSSRSRRT